MACDISCSIRAQVLVSTDARSNSNDVFGAKNFRRNAFVFDLHSFSNRFFSQSSRSPKLNRKIFKDEMFPFDSPTFGLQMRIDRGNSCTQRRVAGDKNDISVVRRERFCVINRSERATERLVFNQPGGDKLIRGPQNISKRDACALFGHRSSTLIKKFVSARPLQRTPATVAAAYPSCDGRDARAPQNCQVRVQPS